MDSLPVTDLALKHTLQSGLALVKGQAMDEGRQHLVLQALVTIFTDAEKGSQALSTRNFFFAADEPPVIERFSLFFKYLHGSMGEDLSPRLSEAAVVLKGLEQNGAADIQAQGRVAQLIEDLLNGLAQESALTPLVSQKEFQLAF